MTFVIQKAQRQKSKLRIGFSGPSGSGKTYSALLAGYGLAGDWSKVCLIDTENGSGSLYSNLGDYNVITITAPFSPERYIEALKAAQDAGMEVVIIDSVSHEWEGKGGCLEINELLGQAKYRGNSWAAWSETTPRHQRFIEAIVQAPFHVITTVRNKIDTIQTDDKKVKKVGTKEIQREGFEYELTVNFNIDRENHLVTASKDRTGLFIHRDPFTITVETGEELRAWNDSGMEAPKPAIDVTREKAKVMHNLKRLGFGVLLQGPRAGETVLDIVSVLTSLNIADEQNLPKAVKSLEAITDAEGSQATYGIAIEERAKVAALNQAIPDEEPLPVEDKQTA
jgi:hypothetical protein